MMRPNQNRRAVRSLWFDIERASAEMRADGGDGELLGYASPSEVLPSHHPLPTINRPATAALPMRVSLLKQRESYERILVQTLARGWTEQFGHRVHVDLRELPAGQRWDFHPMLNAYVCEPVRAPRRLLRNMFRFTARPERMAIQYVVATIASSRVGFAALRQQGFMVAPPIPHGSELVVTPGNQRIRIWNPAQGTVRVILKDGFNSATMGREIAVRRAGGPFPPLVAADDENRWFEEPIIEGYDLARAPPWIPRTHIVARAFRLLESWRGSSLRSVDARERASALRSGIDRNVAHIAASIGGQHQLERLSASLGAVSQRAGQLGQVQVGRTHGDFQLGNIVVSRDQKHVWIIDWEHSGERLLEYDRLVMSLATRTGEAPIILARRFCAGEGLREMIPGAKAHRQRLMAMFLLEELLFASAECLTGPYHGFSPALKRYISALPSLVRTLGVRCS